MTNIKFPETNVVSCVFSLRHDRATSAAVYNEYDMVNGTEIRTLKEYVYRVPEYLQGTLKPHDFVVVHCQTGYQLCQVKTVNACTSLDERTLAPVVAKVDLETYFQEIDKQQQLKFMKQKLDKEKKRLESLVTYELIAEKNPEFKAMLEEFKKLGGEV